MAATIATKRPDSSSPEQIETSTSAPIPDARYIRYLLGFLVGFIIMGIVWYRLAIFQLGTPTESSRWTQEIYIKKMARSNAITTPKLLVVGGSSTLFGISAKQIEDKTHVPTVNMGLHAGLGIEYLLYEARPAMKRGDTVLLSIEYELFTRDEVNDVFLDYIFARDPDYYRSRDLYKRLRYAFALDTDRMVEGCMNRLKHSVAIPEGTEYESATLNEHGDETNNRYEESLKHPCQKKQDEGKPCSVFLDHFSENDVPWKQMREFKQWCDKNGVRVLATFPNARYFPVYDTKASQERFAQLVEAYHRLGIPTVGTPKDFIYDRSYFYDTVYHLNDRGVPMRTEKTIELLEPFISKMGVREEIGPAKAAPGRLRTL